jgi:hypothetical protein
MVNVVSAIREMESHKKVPGGIAAGGICFVLLGISGLFGILTTGALLAIGMFFVALAMMTYNLLSPVDQRFELGTQSAEHQYGPFRIVVESAIEFKGAKEMEENDFKIRTVRCKAVTEDGKQSPPNVRIKSLAVAAHSQVLVFFLRRRSCYCPVDRRARQGGFQAGER